MALIAFSLEPGDLLYNVAQKIATQEAAIIEKDRDIENLNLTLQEKTKLIDELTLKVTNNLKDVPTLTLISELISRNAVSNTTMSDLLLKLYGG